MSITFPWMLLALTLTGAFGFYAGLNVIMFVMIFLFVPCVFLVLLGFRMGCRLPPRPCSKTKQRKLEELDQVFSVPMRVFMRYRITKSLPYFKG